MAELGVRSRIGRVVALGSVAALLVAAAPAGPPTTTDPGGVMVLGYTRARVTVAEYASVGCPHCAHWAHTVYPGLKAKYIDTGKARFAFHEMLTGNPALAAAGFLTARCAGPAKYFQVVDEIFARQEEIGEKGIGVLEEIAEHGGLTHAQFDACLNDSGALKALNERTEADARAHDVNGTPTFFVNGVRMQGDAVLADFDTAIARAQHK